MQNPIIAKISSPLPLSHVQPLSELGECFRKKYAKVEEVVAFNPAWANHTEYFDHAVKLDKLEPGKTVKTVDNFGRQILLTGTRFGNIIVFWRYARNANTLAMNVPDEIRELFQISNRVDIQIFDLVFGIFDNAIGERIEGIFGNKAA